MILQAHSRVRICYAISFSLLLLYFSPKQLIIFISYVGFSFSFEGIVGVRSIASSFAPEEDSLFSLQRGHFPFRSGGGGRSYEVAWFLLRRGEERIVSHGGIDEVSFSISLSSPPRF